MIENARIQIGILGNDECMRRYHLPYLLCRQKQFQVKTIFSYPFSETELAAAGGIRYTNSVNELISDPELDLIVIAFPIDVREMYTYKVLGAGKHCVVETPFVLNSLQAENLFRYAQEKGVILQICQNRRYDSDYLTLQRIINSGCLGEIMEVEFCSDCNRPDMNQNDVTGIGHTFWYEQGAHMIDLAVYLFGEPDNVHYDIRTIRRGGEFVNDYFDVDLLYDKFKVALKAGNFRVNTNPYIQIRGSNGNYVKQFNNKEDEYGALTYYDSDNRLCREKVRPVANDYGHFYDALYDCLCHESKMPIDPAQTVVVYRILEDGLGQQVKQS